jgi:hypothetical protein
MMSFSVRLDCLDDSVNFPSVESSVVNIVFRDGLECIIDVLDIGVEVESMGDNKLELSSDF